MMIVTSSREETYFSKDWLIIDQFWSWLVAKYGHEKAEELVYIVRHKLTGSPTLRELKEHVHTITEATL